MTIQSNNKNKISKDYFVISSVIIIAVVIISIWQTWSVYNSKNNIKQEKLFKQSNRISREFTSSLDYVSNLMKFMGQQIVNDDPNDLQKISSMLQGKLVTGEAVKKQFSLAMFDWSREDKKIIVTTPYGIMKEPIDISHRYYAKMADAEPWVLHTDPADIGVTSGQWIIPAGMGITDSNGKFIGTISMGFNVAKLTRNIESILDSEDVSFVILDKDNKIALSSEDVKYDQIQRDYFSKELENKLPENGSGRLPLNLTFQNIKYYYYNKIDGYPYTILMGYNKAIFNKEFNETLLPGITGYLIIGTLSLLLLLTLRNLVVKPITDLSKIADQISKGQKITRLPRSNSKEITALSKQFVNAIRFINKEKILKKKAEQDKQKIEELVKIHQEYDKEKEEFLRDMYHMLNTPLNAVINGADIARTKMLGDNIDNYTQYFEAMYEAGIQLKCFTTEFINPELVDIKQIINKCVKIQLKFASEKRSQLSYQTLGEIPEIWADRIRLKQIILSTLYHSLFYVPAGKKCKITTSVECLSGGEPACLIIKIEDNGWGYDEKMRADDWEIRFGKEETSSFSRNPDMMKLSISTIRHMVKLHHGSFDMQAKSGSGSVFTIRLPYLPKEDLIIHPDDYAKPAIKKTIKKESNVVLFPR